MAERAAAGWAAASTRSCRPAADEEGLREIPLELIEPNPRQPRRVFDAGARSPSWPSRSPRAGCSSRSSSASSRAAATSSSPASAACAPRRWPGSRAIPAMIRDADDWERLDLALAENMAREDLNAVEAARACALLVDDLGLTKGEVGRRVGRSRVAISNLIRLLDLPEEALELIEARRAHRGPRPRDADLQGPRPAQARWPATPATTAGRCARRSAAPGRARTASAAPGGPQVVVHPDLEEALAAAEDALSAALGRPVKVRADGRRLQGRARLRRAPPRPSRSPSGSSQRARAGRLTAARHR